MITVTPSTFEKVAYDAAEIEAIAADLCRRIDGVPDDLDVELVIDENEPTTRMAITSLDPAVFSLEGGALENTRRPQSFSAELAANSIARMLFEYADRTDPAFGAPELGEPSDLARRVVWDTYCYGRASRLGIRVYRPKHLYNFRNRLGFSDDADAMFDRLWSASGLTWVDLDAMAPAADD